MNRAIDVAMYIINICNKKDNFPNINGCNLQPILFLVQAYFLKYADRPCFEDKIIKSNMFNTIIINDVNNTFPFLLCFKHIYFQNEYYINTEGQLFNHRRDSVRNMRKISFKWNNICISDRLMINDVLEKIKDFDSKELHDMVMEIPVVKNAQLVITKEEIYNYVKGKEMKFWE